MKTLAVVLAFGVLSTGALAAQEPGEESFDYCPPVVSPGESYPGWMILDPGLPRRYSALVRTFFAGDDLFKGLVQCRYENGALLASPQPMSLWYCSRHEILPQWSRVDGGYVCYAEDHVPFICPFSRAQGNH